MRSNAISLLALASLALASSASALEIPALQGRVNDHANLLPAPARVALEQKLEAYERQTGHQFALLTVPTLEGQVIEDFSMKVAERWKLGSAKGDQGLILIIALNDRKMRVEVGYGLEGVIPDAVGARVIREVLAPAFRGGEYAQGVNSAFDMLMKAASGELPPETRARPRERRRGTLWGVLSPILVPIAILIFFSMLSGGGRRRRGMWGAPFIGGFGGGGGGVGFGGGGGGGFSGGGGGFGGGGASGSW